MARINLISLSLCAFTCAVSVFGVCSPGEVSCPPCPPAHVAPLSPTPIVLGADASQEAKDTAQSADDSAVVAYDLKFKQYSSDLEAYHHDLTAYTQWVDEDARAAAVLTSSVLPQYAAEFMSLPTVAAQWAHLRQRYQPSGDALYLSVVRQEHALQQGDSIIDEFYTQSAAIWRQLDSLRTAVCGTCSCCQIVRSDLEFHRIYEFLSRLRQEFESRRAQLNARGHVPLSEVLSELRAEETRLRGTGLLAVSSVLATRGPPMPSAPLTQPRSSVPPPILPISLGQGQSQHQQSQSQSQHQQVRGQGRRGSFRHCSYCNKDGHTWATCYTRDPSLRQQHQMARGQSVPSGSSAVALSDQDIIRSLRGLLASTGSSSTGTAGSVTDSSGTARPPPSTQSGTSTWYLDSRASFHMTSESFFYPLFVLSLLLSVFSRLMVPLFLSLVGALVGAVPRSRDSSGLSKLDWLRVPSAATSSASSSPVVASATSSFQQWHHRLGHLCDSHLSSLVHRGLLGSVSGDGSLHCQSCRLGKQIQLPYPTSVFVSQRPFDLVHSDVWGPTPFASKGGHHYYILFIDDFSRYTWLYFMRSRSEVLSIYQRFAAMVRTQYSTPV
uniref:Uncharacterized protein n=1 Tax=Avena sativa TaxID=4498 RepID=A0ACD5ZXF1_AVESA